MARLSRFTPPGYAQHVIQRGNNRQIIFCCDDDRAIYTHWLREYSERYDVAIHAWVYMTNHVHLLPTPGHADSLSRMMQAVGRQYVRYFNKQYRRTGTLFEGRYRSCLVADDGYLLTCYRYIELNPVRAHMVDHPGNYHWSSYSSNALGKQSELLSPHRTYLGLGDTPVIRQAAYRRLFDSTLNEATLQEIRCATNKGLAIGDDRFKQEIESTFSRRVTPGVRGRPRIEKREKRGSE
jgi:putative transposase